MNTTVSILFPLSAQQRSLCITKEHSEFDFLYLKNAQVESFGLQVSSGRYHKSPSNPVSVAAFFVATPSIMKIFAGTKLSKQRIFNTLLGEIPT
eukprot:scaffold2647_cov75-Cylindrotheca_fusiformis.AAC.4